MNLQLFPIDFWIVTVMLAQGDPADMFGFICPVIGFVIVPGTIAVSWWSMKRPRMTPGKWMSVVFISLMFLIWLVVWVSYLSGPSHEDFAAGEELSELPEIQALDQLNADFRYKDGQGVIYITVDGRVAGTQQPFHEKFRRDSSMQFQVWQSRSGTWATLDQWRAMRAPVATQPASRP